MIWTFVPKSITIYDPYLLCHVNKAKPILIILQFIYFYWLYLLGLKWIYRFFHHDILPDKFRKSINNFYRMDESTQMVAYRFSICIYSIILVVELSIHISHNYYMFTKLTNIMNIGGPHSSPRSRITRASTCISVP